MTLRTVSTAFALVGALVSIIACFYGADYSFDWTLVLLPLFAAWVMAPFWVAWRLAQRADLSRWAEILIVTVVAAMTAVTVYIYASFAMRTVFDAQDGLIFAVIPAYLLIAITIVYAILEAFDR